MRYIVAGTNRPDGPVNYISSHGNLTFNAERAAIFKSIKDAELPYWQGAYSAYKLRVEQLPPRVSVMNAVLRAQPVEEII